MQQRNTWRLSFLLTLGSFAAVSVAEPIEGLRYIGRHIITTGTQQLGTTVGGLSGSELDSQTGTYYVIGDNRSAVNPARFYNLSTHFDRNGVYRITFNSVVTMKRSATEGGGNFPTNRVDPELIRHEASSGTLDWTGEGEHRPHPRICRIRLSVPWTSKCTWRLCQRKTIV